MQRLNAELEKHMGKFSETSQASKKELERLTEDRERLSREINTTKTENERLREELSRLHRSLDSSSHGAKDEVSRLQKMIDSLHTDLSRLNAEREKLTDTMATKERQFDKMDKQLAKVILTHDPNIQQMYIWNDPVAGIGIIAIIQRNSIKLQITIEPQYNRKMDLKQLRFIRQYCEGA